MLIFRQAIRYRRILLLIVIMALVTSLATSTALWALYTSTFNNKKDDLTAIVTMKANLINAVARFDAIHASASFPEDPFAATLSQVIDANQRYHGFSQTGEFILARLETEQIYYIVRSRAENPALQKRAVIATSAALQKAFAGDTGVILDHDYRNRPVLAAYTPLENPEYALVAKIDLQEIQAPFFRAASVSLTVALALIMLAVYLIHHLASPLIFRLEALVAERTRALHDTNKELALRSQQDHLTEVCNRSHFFNVLSASRRQSDTQRAILFIDLDKFKPINDELGHHVGDQLLRHAAQRFVKAVRQHDTVARIGGDEFAILLNNIETIHHAIEIATDITSLIQQPFSIQNHRNLRIGCSIGIALDDNPKETEEALVSRADTAMYHAKSSDHSNIAIS